MDISFTFKFPEEPLKRFFVSIDDKRLSLPREKKKNYPHWAKISFHRCPKCSCRKANCPAAVNLIEPLQYFAGRSSCEKFSLTIHVNGKSFERSVNLETALSALFSILLWPGECPVFGKLKFLLIDFNLFPKGEEFVKKTLENYFMAHGVRTDKHEKNETRLFALFSAAREAGKYFCRRFSEISEGDAVRNALSRLDSQYLNVLQAKGKSRV